MGEFNIEELLTLEYALVTLMSKYEKQGVEVAEWKELLKKVQQSRKKRSVDK